MKKNIQYLYNKLITNRLFAISFLVLLLLLLYVGKSIDVGSQIAQATEVKQETFTELYFLNNNKLPSILDTGKIYTFSFVIHNMEGKTMTYTYEVSMQSKTSKEVIDKKTITIANNESQNINESFIFATPIQDAEITVKLVNMNQQIDFWVNK